MKVCHVTSVHKAKDVRILLKECVSLSKKYDTTLLCNDLTSDISSYKNVKIVNIKLRFKDRLERIRKSNEVILKEALKINAEVYHLHDPELLGICKSLKKHGKKVVFDAHEDTPKQILAKHYIPKILRKPVSLTFKYYEYSILKKVDAIITATPNIRKKFKHLNVTCIDINNFPILNEFIDLNNDFNKKLNQIVYVGGLSKERGIFEIITLANELPNYYFIICGEFSSDSEKKIVLSKIKHRNVDFTGFIDRNGIRQALVNSKVGLVLLEQNERYQESLPIKMFEYMAAGLPVIVSDFKLWRGIIEDSGAGYTVNPKDINKIKQILLKLMQDNSLAYIKGQSGKKYVINQYNWENEEKKLFDVYKTLEG